MVNIHADCRFFLANDVAKGQCLRNNIVVAWDDRACQQAEKANKCKFCANFSAEQCQALGGYWAYADMRADNCSEFSQN